MKKLPHPRGQTLALFGLTLFLLTLLVCMTLSFGTKAKEKMELQQVADQAAYSNAVYTARTFNSIALLNRAKIAHHVALLGVQSALSYAAAYRGYLNWLFVMYIIELVANQIPQCDPPFQLCGCFGIPGVIFGRMIPIIREIQRIRAGWDPLDQAAALQARNNQSQAATLYFAQLDAFYRELYFSNLRNQQLTRQVVNRAAGGEPEWQAPNTDSVTVREVGLFPSQGAVLQLNIFNRHQVWATMGSLGHPFVTSRFWDGGLKIQQALRGIIGNDLQGTLLHMGSAYYSPTLHGNTLFTVEGTFAWADDHGFGVERYSGIGCSGLTLPVFSIAWAKSTDLSDNMDQHFWLTLLDSPDAQPAEVRHTMGSCFVCPSVWTRFVDYDWVKVAMGGDAFGQPKNHAVVQRDYTLRPRAADPWNLAFRFRFTPAGEDLELGRQVSGANQRIVLRNGGIDVSRQTALSTGITYYHRAGHWKEPPNLFNPFWRAGLVHADVDDQARSRGGDVAQTLNGAGVGWAAQAWGELHRVGYRGIQ